MPALFLEQTYCSGGVAALPWRRANFFPLLEKCKKAVRFVGNMTNVTAVTFPEVFQRYIE
jgi:hypothetical protein